MIIIQITLIFLLLVLLLRLKIPFTIVILFLALVVGLKFGMNFGAIAQLSLKTIQQTDTLSLVAIVGLILVFSELLSQSGNLTELSKVIVATFGPHRFTFMILPALIGLLPMPGGALFSAPMVEGFADKIQFPAHKKTLFNYWFRHIWEYAWPLYAGLILAADLSHVPLYTFSFSLSPLCLVAILSGVIFILPGIIISPQISSTRSLKTFLCLFYLLLPIGLIIILFLIWHLPMWLCMSISVSWVVLNSLFSGKLNIKQVFMIIFGNWRNYQMMLMVASVLVFVGILRTSDLTVNLVDFFKGDSGQSVPLGYCLGAIIFFPFIMGLLTGLTIAFVGPTFPIIFSAFIPSGYAGLPFMFLAYISGFAGVMLSPTHLCLILTNQYFGSSLKDVYRYLIPMVTLVFLSGVGLFWIYLKFY